MSSEIVRLKNGVSNQDHVTGPSAALVTLVEYGNFECIHCGQTYPVIKQIRNLLSNDLRFVFRHFATVRTHPHSVRAAEAAEAAGVQGKFWEMHDELFAHQTALSDRHLLGYAKRIGLDVDRFSREMSENVFLPQVETGYRQSVFDEHVTGTPTLYLNETRYTGATHLQALLEAIKQSDPQDRIWLPTKGSLLRKAVSKLRQALVYRRRLLGQDH